jgi:hypothetical protein
VQSAVVSQRCFGARAQRRRGHLGSGADHRSLHAVLLWFVEHTCFATLFPLVSAHRNKVTQQTHTPSLPSPGRAVAHLLASTLAVETRATLSLAVTAPPTNSHARVVLLFDHRVAVDPAGGHHHLHTTHAALRCEPLLAPHCNLPVWPRHSATWSVHCST